MFADAGVPGGSDRRSRGGTTVPPAALLLGGVLVQRAVVAHGPRLHDRAEARRARQLGAAVAVPAAVVLVAPVAVFRRRGTTVDPRQARPPAALVVSGANGVTRNPMYVGMAALLVAHGLWLGSMRALGVVLPFVWWLDRVQVPREEQVLREVFGADYQAYAAVVPRWLPRPRRRPE